MKITKLKQTVRPKRLRTAAVLVTALTVLAACGGGMDSSASERPDGVPAKGESKTIDSILDRGNLRVGVFLEFPWLTKTKSGSTEPYEGPAWFLASKIADALGVEVEPVEVSNDTKVATVPSHQVDLAIAPLTVTDERKKVIDFIVYTEGTICFFGLKSDPKLEGITTVDDLKASKGLTLAYYVGQPVGAKKLFPNIKVKGVSGSGEAPIPELTAGRADLVTAICAKSKILKETNKGLFSIPEDPTKSDIFPNPIGMGIAKDDPVFEKFVNKVKDENLKKVEKIEHDRILGLDK